MKLAAEFFHRGALDVARDLVGKGIVRRLSDGTLLSERISETEAYCTISVAYNYECGELHDTTALYGL